MKAVSTKPCSECGGPKPPGRGRKYCNDCTVSCSAHRAQTRGCTECRSLWIEATGKSDEYKEKHKEVAARSYRRRTYDLTDAELDELMAVDACQICGAIEDLKIDHCHTSGNVRGMLCNSCNLALGMMKDDPERLRKAADYLSSFLPTEE